MRAAAVAVGQYDEEQRKAAEQKRKADEEARKQAEEEKRKAAEGVQKKVTLVNKGGSGTCDQTATYVLRLYPNKIDIMFGNVWRSLAVDAEGTFSRNLQIEGRSGSIITLSVNGSVKNGFISIVNLGGRGCTWAGKF